VNRASNEGAGRGRGYSVISSNTATRWTTYLDLLQKRLVSVNERERDTSSRRDEDIPTLKARTTNS
jgi:hypothetical protein